MLNTDWACLPYIPRFAGLGSGPAVGRPAVAGAELDQS
jgi:hypothetical protein